jgi:hypothetical protein|tara:strand:+ start:458 stop:610 length:153 start_codon:yes stop_codon:yes gene_type:complete
MNNSVLPPQTHVKINNSLKKDKEIQKSYEYIDINLDKNFLDKYFQNIKKK